MQATTTLEPTVLRPSVLALADARVNRKIHDIMALCIAKSETHIEALKKAARCLAEVDEFHREAGLSQQFVEWQKLKMEQKQ